MRTVATVAGAAIESPWFTAEEAAAYLRIVSADGSLHAFYLAYPRLKIPAYRLDGGRALRFRQEDLDAALKRARVQEDEPSPRGRAPGVSALRPAAASRARTPRSEADIEDWRRQRELQRRRGAGSDGQR